MSHPVHACHCHAHRASAKVPASGGLWSAVLPVLACAICPACMATYAKLFSVLGVGFGLDDLQHLVLLGAAIAGSIALSAWRTFRTRRTWPLAIALTGSLLVALGHLGGDLHYVEWAGIVVLLAGGLGEHFRLRQRGAPVPA